MSLDEICDTLIAVRVACDPEGVDADALLKVLNNPEMAALLTSLAKGMKAIKLPRRHAKIIAL